MGLKHQLMLNKDRSWVPCYLKSEADRYIAELQSANQLEIDEWYNKLMRQKYKRCLAMAKWCAAERDIYRITPYVTKEKLYRKWHKRWLELAAIFKEGK